MKIRREGIEEGEIEREKKFVPMWGGVCEFSVFHACYNII